MGYLASGLEAGIRSTALEVLIIGAALTLLATIYLLHHKHSFRPGMFYGFAGLSGAIFFSLVISTVAIHIQSDSFGKHQRQASIEFWVCGTEVSPRYQQPGIFHTAGSRDFYIDASKQVHRSGFVVNEDTDATLGYLFTALGGSVQSDHLTLPLDPIDEKWLMPAHRQDGDPQGNMSVDFLQQFVRTTNQDSALLELSSGQRCHDGASGQVQIFVYQLHEDGTSYSQTKLEKPDDHIIPADSSQPSQCIIVEFSAEKERTNKLCESFGVRDNKRCSAFGVENLHDDACYLTEVQASGEDL